MRSWKPAAYRPGSPTGLNILAKGMPKGLEVALQAATFGTLGLPALTLCGILCLRIRMIRPPQIVSEVVGSWLSALW